MISHDHFLLLVNSTNKLSHLVLCCVQFSGVKPQSVSWGRVLPARGVGIGVKPGVAGALGALGSRYGAKAMKTGMGRYPGAQLGAGGYRVLGLGSRAGLKPGAYGTQGAYGAHLGTGMGLGTGLTNGLGLSLGQGPKRAYGAGHGTLPGYGALAGLGYPGARPGIGLGYAAGQKAKAQKPGYGGGAGLGASLGAGGYGAGLGQGAYLGGAAGKLGGYGDGATGYLGAVPGNGLGYGNGYSDGYGAGLGYPAELADVAENKAGKSEALSTGGYAGPVQGAYGALGAGALGTGLESAGGKYGGGAPQVPYGNAPVIPTGLEGDGGYPYSPQQIALGAEGAKTASKYGAGAGYGVQQTGYGAQLGAAHDALGEQAGKYGVNGYKG
ncbi:fibroin heavy chain isoform X11 [Acanthopagrus latus]|uniref:fibroin heavy chain isoform X11 n=1 Tax=Acanthopagrus latus TaxID=8177 RepID=UPI00187BF619|nr:fibroin heavy chain isoform X11 [Acanthopagrus latus]